MSIHKLLELTFKNQMNKENEKFICLYQIKSLENK